MPADGLVAVYPGSFNPPTVAHLAIAAAARRAGIDRVELVISGVALGKEGVVRPTPDERIDVLHAVAADRPWLGARTTDARLIADIARGADAVIVGADKWAQVVDPAWYGGTAARDRAVRDLPLVLIAPRRSHPLPLPEAGRLAVLELDERHTLVSSSDVRAGRREWILPEADASGLWPA